MKVLYVMTRAERGGAQVHLLDLLTNLPEAVRPIVATGEGGFLCDEVARRGIPVRRVRHLTHPIHPLKDLFALVELTKLIRREAPDLIHAHTSKAGLLARLAGRLTGTPTVFTAHTWSFADGVSRVQQRLAIPLERLAASLGGQIITVSEANRTMALRRRIAPASRLVGIWNGVPDVPQRASPGRGDPLTIIMIARFVPQKDHLLLIEALSGVGGKWRLLLVGDGPLRPRVEESIAAAGLGDRIQCLGDRSDIPELLSRADLFVLATKWEGLPLSILEAMRAGVPVAATNVGGVAEAVTDGVTGYLIARGDVGQIRDRIERLLVSRELLESMGQSARRRYEQDFNVKTMVTKTWAVYRAAVNLGNFQQFLESTNSMEVSER
jgi:glycosyltransferase involved in cell wall biosynthesis